MDEIKKRVGKAAADLVKSGMVVGLGSGSTATWFIICLAERYHKENLDIVTVSSSKSSHALAMKLGLPYASIDAIDRITVTFDGADEIDDANQIIKGKGGALLREKILAYSSDEFIVLVDETKCSKTLGKVALPVEVTKFGYILTAKHLMPYASHISIRTHENGTIYNTDNDNFIFDLELKPVTDWKALENNLKKIPGIVETGIFLNCANRVIIGKSDGTIQFRNINP